MLERVRELAGHAVSEDTIRRRYDRSLFNFFGICSQFADSWLMVNNSVRPRPRLVAKRSVSGTIEWLFNTLTEIGKRSGAIAEILTELASRANSYVAPLSGSNKRLSILISGFVYWENTPKASAYVVSNHENGNAQESGFTIRSIPIVDSALVEITGRQSAIPLKTLASLRGLLSSDLDPRAVLRAAVKHLRLAASGSGAAGSIGKQCNAAIIPAERDSLVTTTYHSAVKSHRAYGANVVLTNNFAAAGFELFSSAVLASGEIKKRDPCWCGSAKAYKHCHMKKYGSVVARIPMFKKPLPALCQVILETPRASGKVFSVSSGYAAAADD